MALQRFLQPWQGTGFRHQPQNSPFAVTDTRFLGQREGRWHRKGEHAFYLASDASVMATEFARWLGSEAGAIAPQARDVFELDVVLQRVLDLRDAQVQAALGISQIQAFFPWSHCQTYAALARIHNAQAILVPPIGTLDKPDTWNLVVFTEAFQRQTTFVQRVRHVGVIQVNPV